MSAGRLTALALVAACAGPGGGVIASAPRWDAPLPPAELARARFPSGFTLLGWRTPGSATAAVQLWVRAGAADEGPAEIGAAHMLEHLLFRGSELSRRVEAVGGEVNAFTSHDHIVFQLSLPAADLAAGVDALADALTAPLPDAAGFAKEQQVVLAEIAGRADEPQNALARALYAHAFGKHPYARPVVGDAEAVRTLTPAAVAGFRARALSPERMVLVVVSPAKPESLPPLLPAAWTQSPAAAAAMPSSPAPPRPAPPEPAGPRAITVVRDTPELEIELAFRIPGATHADVVALDVAAAVLGQGSASRLDVDVRRDQRLVGDVAAYTWTPRDAGLFVIGARVVGDDPERAARAILAEVFELAGSEPTAEELRRARAAVESGAVFGRETADGLARKLGWFEVVGGGVGAEARYLQAVRALDGKGLRAAVARHLRAENLVIAVLVPKNRAAAGDAALARTRARLEQAAADEERHARARAAHLDAGADAVERVLPSGVRVIVVRDPGAEIVALSAVWPGGQLAEADDTAGWSSLASTLLTRGSARRGGDELAGELAGLGASLAGHAGKSAFGLRGEALARDWEQLLGLAAECLREPSFAQAEIERRRSELEAARRMRASDPTAVALDLLDGALFPGHAYARDPLGEPAALARADSAGLAAWYQRQYPLSAMTLAVVGDVEPERVIALAGKLFPGAPGAAMPPRATAPAAPAAPAARGPRELYRFLPVGQAHVLIGFRGVGVGDGDRFALDLLAVILAGQSGRLTATLREQRGLAYHVAAWSQELVGGGHFAVSVQVAPAHLDEALAVVRAELARLAAAPADDEELARAKRYLIGRQTLSLEPRLARAGAFALAAAFGMGWQAPLRYADAIAAVDGAALQRVARDLLAWEDAVIVVVKPKELSPGAAERAKGKKTKAKKPEKKGK